MQLLPPTLSCVHPLEISTLVYTLLVHVSAIVKVAQINLSSYVCIDTQYTLVGSLLILIQINRGFV